MKTTPEQIEAAIRFLIDEANSARLTEDQDATTAFVALREMIEEMAQQIERMRPVVEAALGLFHDDYEENPTYFEHACADYEAKGDK